MKSLSNKDGDQLATGSGFRITIIPVHVLILPVPFSSFFALLKPLRCQAAGILHKVP
jgi:hypothetical protein